MGNTSLRQSITALPGNDGDVWAKSKSALHVQRIVDVVRQSKGVYVQVMGELTQASVHYFVKGRGLLAMVSAHAKINVKQNADVTTPFYTVLKRGVNTELTEILAVCVARGRSTNALGGAHVDV